MTNKIWNASSATNMSCMFSEAGNASSAANWIVKIPAISGTTLDMTYRFYGSGTTYASPASGKSFTLAS